MHKTISLLTWNVRGLGQDDKCDDVLMELITASATIVGLQETKLSSLTPSKARSFLPARLSSYISKDEVGAAGGIVLAWDPSIFYLCSSSHSPFSISTVLSFKVDGNSFTCTYVYAPTVHTDKPAFLANLALLPPAGDHPWAVFDDFNLTYFPDEKNTDAFHADEATSFNASIHALALLEIPLLERLFTWSSRRE
ncbi:uncharacterized protein [Miscanthus floridulus]|uniref:uncharacterized protein n=1 Tax=Miscanthus floridulus TaxID=154761 RepID=UPI003459E39F